MVKPFNNTHNLQIGMLLKHNRSQCFVFFSEMASPQVRLLSFGCLNKNIKLDLNCIIKKDK